MILHRHLVGLRDLARLEDDLVAGEDLFDARATGTCGRSATISTDINRVCCLAIRSSADERQAEERRAEAGHRERAEAGGHAEPHQQKQDRHVLRDRPPAFGTG